MRLHFNNERIIRRFVNQASFRQYNPQIVFNDRLTDRERTRGHLDHPDQMASNSSYNEEGIYDIIRPQTTGVISNTAGQSLDIISSLYNQGNINTSELRARQFASVQNLNPMLDLNQRELSTVIGEIGDPPEIKGSTAATGGGEVSRIAEASGGARPK